MIFCKFVYLCPSQRNHSLNSIAAKRFIIRRSRTILNHCLFFFSRQNLLCAFEKKSHTCSWTTMRLGFSLTFLYLCFLAMVVGNNESTTTKNSGKLLVISIIMAIKWYDAGRIARWSTSRASFKTTRCRHWSSAWVVSPRRPPWSTNSKKTHKTLPKHNF